MISLLPWSILITSFSLSSTLATPPQTPEYIMEAKKTGKMEAIFSWKIECPNLNTREWLVFSTPAPELPSQRNVSTKMQPEAKQAKELTLAKRSILVAQVPVDDPDQLHRLIINIQYKATLYARQLRKLKPGETPPEIPPLSEVERKTYLLPLGSMDYRSKTFQDWLKKKKFLREKEESEIDFARRVFLLIRKEFTYDYAREMNRKALHICQVGKADCGGLSILFSAVMRSNKIPCRSLYGRWAMSAKKDDQVKGIPYTQGHAIAEFFAQGVGWIPVDLASAIVHDQSPEGLHFFGQQIGNFFTQHIDPDYRIDTLRFGTREVHGLQNPAYMVLGVGSLQPTNTDQDWRVREIP